MNNEEYTENVEQQDNQDDYVSQRSEFVFLYDASDTNPNGEPESPENRPRVNPNTGEAVVTDVRLKRYLREQMIEDGYNVYIRRPDEGNVTRDELIKQITDGEFVESYIDDPENATASDVVDALVENAIDTRLFGATFSFAGHNDFTETLSNDSKSPKHLTGAVQISPAQSLNAPVNLNDAYNSLTSVVATQEGKDGGGYALNDHRVQYAVFPFHGVVNNNQAQNTRLTNRDVDLLDSGLWRSIKNQTLTRSKKGQQPRLYVRVEYKGDNYHIGELARLLSLDDDLSESPSNITSADDVVVDVTDLVNVLADNSERIDTVYVVESDLYDFAYDGDVTSVGELMSGFLDNVVEFNPQEKFERVQE